VSELGAIFAQADGAEAATLAGKSRHHAQGAFGALHADLGAELAQDQRGAGLPGFVAYGVVQRTFVRGREAWSREGGYARRPAGELLQVKS
jgi:hypothetical protein